MLCVLSEKLENFRIKMITSIRFLALMMTDLWQRGLSLYYMDRYLTSSSSYSLVSSYVFELILVFIS